VSGTELAGSGLAGAGLALAVGLAGAAGSVLRVLADRAALRLEAAVQGRRSPAPGRPRMSNRTTWPWGTLAVNAAGSLLMGFVVARVLAGGLAQPVGTVLSTGLCGGLTTFSSFTVGTVGLWEQGRRRAAAANVAANLAIGIGLAGVGLWAGGSWG
jgi:CrcB protein